MSRTIRTYNDLLLEKDRLQSLLDAQKELIKLDMDGIKSGLKPASSVLSFVGSFGKKTVTNPLLGMAVSLSTDLLMRKFLFKRAGWAVKTVLPFVVRKVTNNIVSNPAKPSILSKLVKKIT
ncbi:MAG: hypothetical protein EOO02_19885 [Chitinophagaceae bacterium]|nr:MAG: hypothetical protein EOO02_19885 [Chitinophagaceae bacterium]